MLFAMLFVLTLFAAQLVRIQGIDAGPIAEAAKEGRLVQQRVPAKRGQIQDVNGVPLAVTTDRFDITADPTAVGEYTKRVDGTKQKVGVEGASQDIAALTDTHAEDLVQTIQKTKGRFVYLVKDVAPETWYKVRDLGIPGIYAEPTSRREYPRGSALAPVVGYLGASQTPAAGVEQLSNAALRGQDGSMSYERGAGGQRVPSGSSNDVPAQPGKDVRLTIDADVQWHAANALAAQVRTSQAESGTVIVMRRDGDIVAMASYPAFDPETVASSKNAYLRNRAVVDVFEPGSTGKVVTMAALLETGKANAQTRVVVPYSLRRAGSTFHDSHGHETQYLTLAGVLAQSSNTGTVLLGEKLTASEQETYLRKFGLGKTSGLGFPGESPGLLTPSDQWSAAQRYTVMFGQGVSGTALQQIQVFQTVANGGVHNPLRLVRSSGQGKDQQENPRGQGERVVSASTADALTRAMESVVSKKGTAHLAAVDGYRVAGKTSTAQRYDPQLQRYNGETPSFIGYAPASNPEYIVAVTLQRPTVGSIYGGDVAAPVFSKVMGYVLKKYAVPPDAAQPRPAVPLEYDPAVQKPQVQDGTATDGDSGSGQPSPSSSSKPQPASTVTRREEAP